MASPSATPRHTAENEGPDDEDAEFAGEVIAGLTARPMTLPCRYLYDARGSELFEQITGLEEYYPTRAETEILTASAAEIAGGSGQGRVLVEFGSGSSRKTEILLGALPGLEAYVPIDVSPSALDDAAARLAARFPGLKVRPLVADFSGPIELPGDLAGFDRIGFFPGSTIGNLTHGEARDLLAAFRADLEPGGRLIVGVDLVKDTATLLRAYNDPSGVTAAFNLNVLARINRAFGPTFELGQFRHEAVYNERLDRIEMHLVSKTDQVIELLGQRIEMRRGETIHTESSHKYRIEGFQDLARSAGWEPRQVWTDARELFCVHELGLAG